MLSSIIRKHVYTIMVILLLLVGCDYVPRETVQPEFTLTPAELTAAQKTNTHIPSQTSPPTMVNSPSTPTSTQPRPTSTPSRPIPTVATPSRTPTLPPTLTAVEREAYVKELLRTNAGCDLPCWWGIMPGKSQWAETARFLEIIGVKTIGRSEPFGRIKHETGGFDFVSSFVQNSISFSEVSGLVDYILVDGTGYHDVTAFQEAWQTYAPLEIIQKYGKPSRVWLESSYSYDTPFSGYALWLFYDQSGFLIMYAGSIGPKKPIYHICPRFEGDYIKEVNLYLQSAESEKPLEELTYYYSYPGREDYFQPIEKAGITIDEFYNAFLQEEQPCFDVPGNIFP
jgi:hypothetical protein